MDVSKPVPQVTPLEAQELIDNGAYLVDVREANEWQQARIPGATLRPLSTVNDWYEDLPDDITVVLQCRSGRRSNNLAGALINQVGMNNVVNLAGGIIAWSEIGLQVDFEPPSE